MNRITEQVDLPDRSRQPVVHPLDLPEARAVLRRWWGLRALTSPRMALCVALVVWGLWERPLIAVMAGVSTGLLGGLASRAAIEEAWAHIPRRRQDSDRRLPTAWQVVSEGTFSLALLWALWLSIGQLTAAGPSADVRAFVVGAGVCAAGLVALDWGRAVVAGRRRLDADWPSVLPVVGVLVAAVALASRVAPAGTGVSFTTMFGAATVVAGGLVAAMVKRPQVDTEPEATGAH